MGAFETMKGKARSLFANNADKVKGGAEKTGDFVNKKTGGKYQEKVDKAQEKVTEQADRAQREKEGQQPGDTRSEQPRPDEPGPGRPPQQ